MLNKSTEVSELNLSRKWRSQQFGEIIGQDLSVRMLKNSLYLGRYFPVYLFSGQRGCGKTTTARVFAASLNCEKLSSFQKKPQETILPCLECQSCLAMKKNKHPDFIEIDAASHTGVDNVRALIDSSSLLPLLGQKKIYLIDEAHMLSKAAFNALLKILEEPPSSVLFILATTDSQKIIETVKSRCFQLFFSPINTDLLKNHLKNICKSENIQFDSAGLALIVKEVHGSARDAINLLEQVRFANGAVTQEAVSQVLGHLSDEDLITIFEYLLTNKPSDLLSFLSRGSFYQSNALYIWQKLLELLRISIWLKYGVKPDEFMSHHDRLSFLLKDYSTVQLQGITQLLYDNENIFLKTSKQHSFLEMLFLQICCFNKKKNDGTLGGNGSLQSAPGPGDEIRDEDEDDFEDEEVEDEDEQDEEEELKATWKLFVEEISSLKDPLIHSIFQQGSVQLFDKEAKKLTVEFAKDFIFFKDWLQETQHLWNPLLDTFFKTHLLLDPVFTGSPKSREIKNESEKTISSFPKEVNKSNQTKKSAPYRRTFPSKNKKTEKIIDISDTSRWKKANLIVRYFPGTVIELQERV